MRDGLRSGKFRAKPEEGELVSGKMLVQKKLVNAMPEGTDLGGEKMPALASDDGEASEESLVPLEDGAIVSDEMVVPGSKCGEVALTGEGLCNGASEDSRKRSRESCGEGTQCHEPIKKIVKEEALDTGVHFVARVLRSRTVFSSEVGEVGAKAGKRAAELEQKRREGGGFETVTAQAEADRFSNLVEPSFQKLKRKRGRPPKVLRGFETVTAQAEADRFFNLVEPSFQKLKRKRGRPPKVLGKKKGKVLGLRKNERISKTKQSLKQTSLVSSSNRGRRSNGNRYKVKKISPAKKGKHVDLEVGENVPSSGPSLKLEKSSCNEQIVTKGRKPKKDGEVGLSRGKQKGLVRDRIVELLMSAGWTIEYRPRKKREYSDAVYVSPDGKTHWSVTLAYNVLKMRYEAGDAESKAYKTGFVFSPIPEEELSILNKVITKKREGKKKNSSKIAGAIKKKKPEGKLRFGASANNQSKGKGKGKGKGKALLSGKENMSGATQRGTPLLIGTCERRETQNRKRFALLVRNSNGTQPDSENYVLYSGKRTISAWMIDLGTVLDKGKVQYWHPEKTQAKLGGTITRDGIHCDCCGEVITVSEFEAHAGSKLHQPLENTYLGNGMSMLQCQLDSWKKQEKKTGQKWFNFIDVGGDDPNDDTCGICGDGGNLVCCDGCPSTFHQSCLDIQKFPSGDWHCLYCSCKYCGTVGESTREKDSDEETTSSALFKCQLCEEKYHSTCVLAKDAVEGVQILSSFCGKSCQKLYEDIGMLLGVKHELEEGYSFTLVHRFLMDVDTSTDISRKVECNSKVAVALTVMDECFLPASDHRSGIDMIHNILYNCGSNFSRLDFSGFYTAILEKGEEMIAAASIRIHGNQLAEMPFIGTRYMYRRQGMCRRLLNAIESVLRSLKVQNLVIPAISELKETWTSVFGFEPMDVSLKKSLRRMNIVVFPGVDMLQKLLLNHDNAEEKVLPIDLNATCEDTSPDVNTMEGTTSPDINMMEGTPSTTPDEHDIKGIPTVDKSTLFLDSSPNDTSDITSDSVVISDCLEEKKDLAQLGELYDTEERNDVHPHKLPLSDNLAGASETGLNWDEGKGLAESDESHDSAERKNVHLNTVPSASDNNTHVSETDINPYKREHLANERKDLAHLDEPYDSAERKNVPTNTLPSVSENSIHPLQTDLNQNERKDLAQLDEPYDTADGKTVPLSTMTSASDNFTHLSGADCNHYGICGLLLPISHIATSKVDAKLHADSRHSCAESCSISDRADSVDHFAPQECAQIVDTDADCKSNPAGGFPTSHTGQSEESSGDVDAEKQVSASPNGSTCSESEKFHDARDDMLSTAECLSDSDGTMLLDELKSSKGAHLVSSAPSNGCTPSTRSCNQLLEVTHSNPSNEVCPSADEGSKDVANGGFTVPPVDCNSSPCQANGVVTSQGMVDSDCVDVRNQEPFEASKSGTEKPCLLSPTSNGHGMSCEVKSDLNMQPVDGIC